MDLKSHVFTYWYGAPAIIPGGSSSSWYRIAKAEMWSPRDVKLLSEEQFMCVAVRLPDGSYDVSSMADGWTRRHDDGAFLVVRGFWREESGQFVLGWSLRNVLAACAFHATTNTMQLLVLPPTTSDCGLLLTVVFETDALSTLHDGAFDVVGWELNDRSVAAYPPLC